MLSKMRDIIEFINEGKDEKFFNTVKGILYKDSASHMIILRTENYDKNQGAHSQVPKILVKDGDEYTWYTLNMIDTDLDFAAPKDMIGIFINRMFYPVNDKNILLEIVKKYNEQ